MYRTRSYQHLRSHQDGYWLETVRTHSAASVGHQVVSTMNINTLHNTDKELHDRVVCIFHGTYREGCGSSMSYAHQVQSSHFQALNPTNQVFISFSAGLVGWRSSAVVSSVQRQVEKCGPLAALWHHALIGCDSRFQQVAWWALGIRTQVVPW